mmetsp:Transcript_142380/g.248295  ORF Transcript_142380/g.248295 Transcript_142380/m.248295 type:complete len:204 (-) Transcript_142380:1462-2073(-)
MSCPPYPSSAWYRSCRSYSLLGFSVVAAAPFCGAAELSCCRANCALGLGAPLGRCSWTFSSGSSGHREESMGWERLSAGMKSKSVAWWARGGAPLPLPLLPLPCSWSSGLLFCCCCSSRRRLSFSSNSFLIRSFRSCHASFFACSGVMACAANCCCCFCFCSAAINRVCIAWNPPCSLRTAASSSWIRILRSWTSSAIISRCS